MVHLGAVVKLSNCAELTTLFHSNGHKITEKFQMGHDPMVKTRISVNAVGYSWATDGLFLGYKAKRPLGVGVCSS
jgi:hypothetical protein